ncbi:helix-turn-helix domain-containing protein [Saccharicrinis sp. GN24d3]|uniref:helix-turn-helix domain-containing protein n=1 Tax=Saccharicrinis sp. GN24d3 TaxID=3458416 RepID=UPI004035514A
MQNQYSLNKANKSIAVLPFVNMSPDVDNEYFSDGISEEIINALTRVEGLKVIARTSSFAFKGKNIDIRTIGKELGVATILEGSVRKSNNQVRITAQLINAADGVHLWSDNFDRQLTDIFQLQDEVSLLIADQVRGNVGHFDIQDHLVDQSTIKVDAYELFLKGRYFQLKWTPDSIKKAVEYYNGSIKIDPTYARSYYGNVQCYGLLAAWGFMDAREGFEMAGANFLKAKELDTKLPEYSMSYIGKSFWGDWDFESSYRQLSQCLMEYPKYSDALEAMAELCIANGYFSIAEIYIKRALEVDPLSPNHHYTLGNVNYLQGNFEEALVHIDKCLRTTPEFKLAVELKAMCLIWLNRKHDFKACLGNRKDIQLQELLFDAVNDENYEMDKSILESWRNVAADKNQLVPYEIFILANSNHEDEAMELLWQYVAQKRGQIINYRYEPFLYKLKERKDFDALYQAHLKINEMPQIPLIKDNKGSKLNESELELKKEKLEVFIKEKQPFLNARLSLTSLAEEINLHPNKLSYLINESYQLNFNEFINQYRLQHFKQIAVDQKFAHLTILGLAYESGFNSKTVFNAFFKKAEGVTPGTWLKSARTA